MTRGVKLKMRWLITYGGHISQELRNTRRVDEFTLDIIAPYNKSINANWSLTCNPNIEFTVIHKNA